MAEFELIPGYSQILNNSIAACRAIFDSDETQEGPIKVLNSVITDHTITHVAVSKTYTGAFFDDVDSNFSVKYMICKCLPIQNKSYLVISFGETQLMNDFLLFNQLYGEIKDIEGNFHYGIHQKSLQIPIEFYVNKIVNENYDIIFTG
jgi:hypothetical protein